MTPAEKLKARNKAKTARYRERHPEKVKASKKKSNAIQRAKPGAQEKTSSRARDYSHSNPEVNRNAVRKYRKKHPELARIAAHNRRARLRKNGGQLSSNIVTVLMILQQGKCNCCGHPLDNGYELDHFFPISKGGRNDDSNVQLLTVECNRKKHDKMPHEWLRISI